MWWSKKHSTTVNCGRCGDTYVGGSKICACGFPLPPPRRLLSSYWGTLLNKEEIDNWNKR